MKQAFLAPIGTFLLILIASLFVAVRANAINELDNIQIKQTNSFAFSHPKLKDVIVTSALQDNRGQLWIGSEEWLYRYDGFFVEKIDHKYDKNGEASTVPTGIISRLVQLDERYLLIKSNPHKIFIFDLDENKFVDGPYNTDRLSSLYLKTLFRYDNETLVSTSGADIVIFNTKNKTLLPFSNSEQRSFYRSLLRDDTLYALTDRKLHVFDIKSRSYIKEVLLPEKVGDFSTGQIQIQANKIHLLIGNNHWLLDNEKFIQTHQLPKCEFNELTSDTLHAQQILPNDAVIYANQCGIHRYSLSSHLRETLVSNTKTSKWLYNLANDDDMQTTDRFAFATFSGSYVYDNQRNEISRVTQSESDQSLSFSHINDSLDSLHNNRVGGLFFSQARSQFQGISQQQLLFTLGTDKLRRVILLDKGEIAIATQDNGLFVISPSPLLPSKWKVKYHVLENFHVRTLHKDGQNLLVGTEGSGIHRFDLTNGKLSPLKTPRHISSAFGFLPLSNKQLLINTHYELLLIGQDSKNEELIPLKTFTGGEQYRAIAQDKKGNIWLGSHQSDRPLVQLDESLNIITQYDGKTIGHHIFDIFIDEVNTLWLSTWGGGIAIKSREQEDFYYITQQDGLASDTVFSVYSGNDGNLWASTAGGISRIEPCQMPCTPKITSFDSRDALSTDSFDAEAHYQQDDGTLVFAGKGGLVWFSPNSDIHDNSSPPPTIYFNSAKIDSKLLANITLLNTELRLPYSARQLEFRFTSPNYITPEKNQYRYRVNKGDWIDLETPQINLSFLQAGTYQLEATSSNNQGVWSAQPAKLSLVITPPFWQTPYAYLGYVLVILIVGFSFTYWRVQSIKQRNHNLEKLVKIRTASLEKVLHEKEQIFQNISHEFRTPLTIILGQAERLLADTGNPAATLIHEQAERLFALVERLLKLAELRAIKLDTKPVVLVDETQRLISAMVPLAENKNITLLNNTQIDSTLCVDLLEDTLALILNNLLKNAIEYSAANTRVNVSIKIVENRINIKVDDQGDGFSDTEKVLERFSRERNDGLGSGLGLAIVREIVDANGGELYISNKDIGASITIDLPLNLSKQSIHTSANTTQFVTNAEELVQIVAGKVMVVEDDPAMQAHINNVLSPYFDIMLCNNGQEAITQLNNKIMPDMIVSDVMMPVMSGFELCKQLKNDPIYAHISIILLTAKADAQSERIGMIHLADDYITKPFSSQTLVMKISNILKTRKADQARLVSLITENKEVSHATHKDDFADRVRAELAKHFADDAYSITDLANQLHMTERTIARHFQASFNLTFTSLLRDFRLHQAKILLVKGVLVSEAAYACGFSSDSYFGRCYKKKYGITPNQAKRSK